MGVGRVTAPEQDYAWRRAEALEENDKVTVLGQDDCVRLASSTEDLGVFRLHEVQIAGAESLDAKFFENPRRKSGRELRVDPDTHATSTG